MGKKAAMKAVMKKAAMKAVMKKAAMKKTMKKAGMKKAMKAKRTSVIAKGSRARSTVWSGKKQKTATGLTKDKLMKNKSGKIVSKKSSAAGKKSYVKNGLKAWADAVKKARKELGVTGFVAI